MKKIYEVKIEKLSADWGRFEGWEILGFYASKASAEFARAKALQHKNPIIEGRVEIVEHDLIP